MPNKFALLRARVRIISIATEKKLALEQLAAHLSKRPRLLEARQLFGGRFFKVNKRFCSSALAGRGKWA